MLAWQRNTQNVKKYFLPRHDIIATILYVKFSFYLIKYHANREYGGVEV
jgi:hypothetical protein